MSNEQHRLIEYIPNHRIDGVVTRLDELTEQEVLIINAEERTGDYGAYVVMQLRDGDNTLRVVSTGAQNIVAAIQNAIAESAFPLGAKFKRVTTRRGREVWTIQ